MKSSVIYLSILLLFASCSRDYDIELPPNESELVVECYLEDGEPLRALVTETTGILDTTYPRVDPIAATVVVSYGNIRDTLQPGIYLDTIKRRSYNFQGQRILQRDYGLEYSIAVTDTKGRRATGSTRFLPPVEIDSLNPIFNDNQKAYCLVKFRDDPTQENFYLLTIHRYSRYGTRELDLLFDENFVNDQGDVVWASDYKFDSGDSVYARLYHLTPDFHRYIQTIDDAREALFNPFAPSGEVVSNLRGAYGVFASLNVSEKAIQVP